MKNVLIGKGVAALVAAPVLGAPTANGHGLQIPNSSHR